ncbi:uncharacterized protein FOMMEDRAFT_109071 [Fomitiporia mediterranea MF3/22]|uniref:uncharacterized protein n=1 Tax=Fomitiporia mediterranea (strain MF3/22) TaxID=694068 RepID=UPI000440779B|nr:uncharacterized protein FOMMEDRAFT_109071 [Fomitiporia mediterranea MF3/22]EJD01993.1 hypothetical protein FOMMEDRAFT_109071 [Fomitiporia mediterranea MF3/22]
MKRSSLVSSSSRTSGRSRHALDTFSWIFRSNLPPRRGIPLPSVQKRNLFGFGEVLSVLANPGETLRSLTEARRSLEEARTEIREARERSQLPTTHTFSPLPASFFFPRPAELALLRKTFEGHPSFTILTGASSVGKTALLREVLSNERYHVLHFDLRIAGFADLGSLYGSLSRSMEAYFDELANTQGFEEFRKEAWTFKHDRLNVERSDLDSIKTSDIARLMELFQSALLHYWQFKPALPPSSQAESSPPQNNHSRIGNSVRRIGTFKRRERKEGTAEGSAESEETKVAPGSANANPDANTAAQEESGQITEKVGPPAEQKCETPVNGEESSAGEKKDLLPKKRIPVIFFDEAHKLPALIRSTEAMKCLLDAMLVLTKQDRLCHVVHATSDGFYQTWLRGLNIMQHCKIICIGDCSRHEAHTYFFEKLLPTIPSHLLPPSEEDKEEMFERLYAAFGGKLVHWSDFVDDWVNADGNLPIERSSHFLQAYTLLNLQLLHATEAEEGAGGDNAEDQEHLDPPRDRVHERSRSKWRLSIRDRALKRSGKGFKIYSPITESMGEEEARPAFTAMQLLEVMHRLAPSSSPSTSTSVPPTQTSYPERPITIADSETGERKADAGPGMGSAEDRAEGGGASLRYFALCREMGIKTVDDMIRARILELRWAEPVTQEGSPLPHSLHVDSSAIPPGEPSSTLLAGSSSMTFHPSNPPHHVTAPVHMSPPPPSPPLFYSPDQPDSQEQDHVRIASPSPSHNLLHAQYRSRARSYVWGKQREDHMDVESKDGVGLADGLGPTLHPTTPIVAYAMRAVLDEYGYPPPEVIEDDILDDEEVEEESLEGVEDVGRGAVKTGTRGRDGRNSYGGGYGGRESSGIGDDTSRSDYVSLSDVSEY